jgi:hypothetical protein
LPDRITAHFFFLLAGFFGWEITEGRSIYSWQSFGTTAEMFLVCFIISGLISISKVEGFRSFAPQYPDQTAALLRALSVRLRVDSRLRRSLFRALPEPQPGRSARPGQSSAVSSIMVSRKPSAAKNARAV